MADEPEQGPESGADSDADDGAGAGREPGSDGSGDGEQPPGSDGPGGRDGPDDADPPGGAGDGDGPDGDRAEDADGGDRDPVEDADDATEPSDDDEDADEDESGGLQRAPESEQPDERDEPTVEDPSAGPRGPPEDADGEASAEGDGEWREVEPPGDEDGEPAEPEGREPPEPPDGKRPEPQEPGDRERPEPPESGDDEPPVPQESGDDPDEPEDDRDESSEPDGGVAVDRPDNMAEATPVERKTGPASDEEMPLADHIEEMVSRLFVVIAIAGVVSVAAFPFAEWIIDFLWYSVLPGGDVAQPRVYHPLSLLITELKVASLAGLIVALPVFVYETYAFMRPGLYPHERRYYLASVPMSLVLALVGVTFAYFVVLPAIFTYFLYYTETVTTIAFALSDTFNLILLLMGYLALVFQIPLFIMLAIMMGLTTRRWLEDRRLYFWGGFLGVAFLFSPDPTGMAPIMVAVTMVVLFEGTLLLLRWTGR